MLIHRTGTEGVHQSFTMLELRMVGSETISNRDPRKCSKIIRDSVFENQSLNNSKYIINRSKFSLSKLRHHPCNLRRYHILRNRKTARLARRKRHHRQVPLFCALRLVIHREVESLPPTRLLANNQDINEQPQVAAVAARTALNYRAVVILHSHLFDLHKSKTGGSRIRMVMRLMRRPTSSRHRHRHRC